MTILGIGTEIVECVRIVKDAGDSRRAIPRSRLHAQ